MSDKHNPICIQLKSKCSTQRKECGGEIIEYETEVVKWNGDAKDIFIENIDVTILNGILNDKYIIAFHCNEKLKVVIKNVTHGQRDAQDNFTKFSSA